MFSKGNFKLINGKEKPKAKLWQTVLFTKSNVDHRKKKK